MGTLGLMLDGLDHIYQLCGYKLEMQQVGHVSRMSPRIDRASIQQSVFEHATPAPFLYLRIQVLEQLVVSPVAQLLYQATIVLSCRLPYPQHEGHCCWAPEHGLSKQHAPGSMGQESNQGQFPPAPKHTAIFALLERVRGGTVACIYVPQRIYYCMKQTFSLCMNNCSIYMHILPYWLPPGTSLTGE